MRNLFLIFLVVFSLQIFAEKKYDSYFPETVKELPPFDKTVTYGGNLRRTMHLLSTSTKEKPNKVSLLQK